MLNDYFCIQQNRSQIFCAHLEMPRRRRSRSRDEIQLAPPEPSPGSVTASFNALAVNPGSRQSSSSSSKSKSSSSKSSKSSSKISSRSSSGGKYLRMKNLDHSVLTCEIFTASVQVMEEVIISGFLAKDFTSKKVLATKDGVFVYTKKNEDKIKVKLAKLDEKYKKIPKYQFTTRFSVPEKFVPMVVGNFTRGYAGLTLPKILNKIMKAEKEAARSASKSPGAISRRSGSLAEADGS